MTKYQKLNLIALIISYPFRIVAFILIAVIGFPMTNFEDEQDRKYYFDFIKKILNIKQNA